MPKTQKTIVLHGFTKEELVPFIRFIKQGIPEMKNAIFASTTPTSLEWKLSDLIEELSKEHAYMQQNPPMENSHDPS